MVARPVKQNSAPSALAKDSAPTTLPEFARHPVIREHVRRSLASWNAAHPGSSECIARVLLLSDTPSIDANEITDKGYINQAAVLARRAALVAALYSEPAPDGVIVVAQPA